MSFKRHHHFKAHLQSVSHKSKSNRERVEKSTIAVSSDNLMDMTEHTCDICYMNFKFDSQLSQHLKSKIHISKVNDKISGRSEPNTVTSQATDFSLVIPLNLDQSFAEQQSGSMVDSRSTKFNDEDLI